MFETAQTLFWAAFGLIDLDNFELVGIKGFTRFWGLLMFGCYSVINIVVLLNLLIAMMNHSYQLISVSSVSQSSSLIVSKDFMITKCIKCFASVPLRPSLCSSTKSFHNSSSTSRERKRKEKREPSFSLESSSCPCRIMYVCPSVV